MSPSSGPGGTVVALSGTGCDPGLLGSSSSDYALVTVATVPSLSAQLPVNSAGAWSGTVTIPKNATAARAVVDVLCWTDGIPSLLATYKPQSFTVTAASAPTTTAPITVPVAGEQPPPTTVAPGRAKPPPTTTPRGGTRPADGPAAGVPGGGSGNAGPGGGQGSSGGAPPGTAGPAPHTGDGARPVAANLPTPGLTASDLSTGGAGLGWIAWLALALLVAGLVAGALMFRRLRRDEPVLP
jgi:hypothetical protein